LGPYEFVADGQSLVYVPIELTDSDGIINPSADRPVSVHLEGPAQLVLASADPITAEDFRSVSHATFQGRALAILRSTKEPGPVVVTISAPNCEAVVLALDSRRA
jgi:hypothetical protein